MCLTCWGSKDWAAGNRFSGWGSKVDCDRSFIAHHTNLSFPSPIPGCVGVDQAGLRLMVRTKARAKVYFSCYSGPSDSDFDCNSDRREMGKKASTSESHVIRKLKVAEISPRKVPCTPDGHWLDMVSRGTMGDKYRSFLDAENVKDVQWRFGAPPNYDVVNKLFEEGQTKIWPAGSLEEKVQNLVKTWEMEIFHKARLEDFKMLDPYKFTLSINGRKGLTMREIKENKGAYNALLQTQFPEHYRIYNPADESSESSHIVFTTAFPR
ncbi:hypothetical protein AgCh_038862 [Apium graveolens]